PKWMVLDAVPVIPPDLRPLVQLDSGNFATSDLNDLYRRLINRNNRLKKLLELNAPEVIIRNEKRMLQQAADALFDNGRCRRPVLGSNNRPLKSLTDMIKGKQGRFRENLLGKRVDYSARSVIVVGPELKLHQCGLPKKIALELYQPFIIRKLKAMGKADTIKMAKKMLERRDESVWDILEEVVKGHPVLLNRAPTLHRMGIQAFEPVLVEGNAIKIHPLVCVPFNADFDGDQMAVHLPLSLEAQVEALTLLMSTHSVFSPSHGSPVISPTQDMVLGIYYLTVVEHGTTWAKAKAFSDTAESIQAFQHDRVKIHSPIVVRLPHSRRVVWVDRDGSRTSGVPARGRVDTTVGRVLFNDFLPPGMPFYNMELKKKGISDVIADCHRLLGKEVTLRLLDTIKEEGFKAATLAGISIGKDDLRVPGRKVEIIDRAEKEAGNIEKAFLKGYLSEGERDNQLIDVWTTAREEVGKEMMKELHTDVRDGKPYLNPLYLMADSGARGSAEQIRQLAGMRGLMSKPSGKIIKTPIKANFREGLSVPEYFGSTHGARKGLADTALKTSDAGYLTRKVVDVAQCVTITTHDCGTIKGITKKALSRVAGDGFDVPLERLLIGRVARVNVVDPITDEIVVRENELITEDIARRIASSRDKGGLGYENEKVLVRSPLTCEAKQGVCALCYGMDRSTGKLAEQGLAVGVIAAQSIGEPGTQLTMRTFHTGGVGTKFVEESRIISKTAGRVAFRNLFVAKNKEGSTVVLKDNGEILVEDEKGRELEAYPVSMGSSVLVAEGDKISKNTVVAERDPHNRIILAEKSGFVHWQEIWTKEEVKRGDGKEETMRIEVDAKSGIRRRLIIEHKGAYHPTVAIKSSKELDSPTLCIANMPEKAYIEVEDAHEVGAGDLLAKIPREIARTQDITGGLPRVTELLEARKPAEPAVLSEIDGIVEVGERRRGKRTIVVRSDQLSQCDGDLQLENLIVKSNPQGQLVVSGGAAHVTVLDKSGESLQRVNGFPGTVFNAALFHAADMGGEGGKKRKSKAGIIDIAAVAGNKGRLTFNNFVGKASAGPRLEVVGTGGEAVITVPVGGGVTMAGADIESGAVVFSKAGPVHESRAERRKKKKAELADADVRAGRKGVVTFRDLTVKSNLRGQLVVSGSGGVVVVRDSSGSIIEKIETPEGAILNGAVFGELDFSGSHMDEGEERVKTPSLADMTADGGGVTFSNAVARTDTHGRLVFSGSAGLAAIAIRTRPDMCFDVSPVKTGTAVFSLYQEHLVPHGRHVRVHTGDRIRAGEPLIDGLLVPHDVLRISGLEKLQEYLLREVQNVYRAQNVTIDDKHVEIILMQMLRFLKIKSQGDSNLLPGTIVDKTRFETEKRAVQTKKGELPKAEPVLLGITKATLRSESFIAAASFQETTKVLAEAAIAARRDDLVGLKENVILGHMIPAGTGFPLYMRMDVMKHVPETTQEIALNLADREAV
ncbi:MAG: DNA-directed RNA polymerase subunit beta', partial [Planctomycetota bacterium]|nr:DNA-directed RNA polymerase subunit beta' [Planctomycetota bacterium]